MPRQTPFVHLHLHTSYSLLDGACRIGDEKDPQLIAAVARQEMPAVAITDHGVMYGVIEFYKEARRLGIKPIIGCEVYEAPASRLDRHTDGPKPAAHHLILLAADDTGYANLMRLVTAAHLEGFYYKPRVDKELLAKYSRGLIALSACLHGRVADAVLKGGVSSALGIAGEYAEIFGKDNFYLEIQDHDLPEQKQANAGIIELARRTGLPLVATNDVHYLEKSHAAAHAVLLCLQTGTVLSDPNRMRFSSSDFHFRSGAEMAELFADQPQALANTLEIAHRCNVEFTFDQDHFPEFVPPDGSPKTRFLEKLCREGVQRRYGIADPEHPRDDREREIMERLNYEIGVIEHTDFIGYFLVVWDFVRFARERQIPVGPGRGSAAGSLVSYALGITGVDPLRYKLLFERFLNPDRISPPDFDIDFCQFRRGEVIAYVKEKYGREHVAQIITFNSLGAKAVIRDVGRVLQVPLSECDRLAKLVPDGPDVDLKSAMLASAELKQAAASDPNAKHIMESAFVLEGLHRNAGVHAAGVVIGKQPLAEVVPLARDKSGEIITQFSKNHVEALGLLKADFLGLRTLTVMDETVRLVRQTRGVELDPQALPTDDPATYELLQRGDTVGVFQLESPGMRDLVRRISPDKIEDLIALVALFRPGPMRWLDSYVERKSGKVRIEYDDPRLEPILAETYGIMLYQEQVQQAAHVLAGFSMAQGDLLRRAMSKKNEAEMEKQRRAFVEGCHKKNAMPAHKAEMIFDNIREFAGYGFNKSHSTGYAVVAYQTAWLKTHYPEEFMAALLSSEIGNTDELAKFMRETQEMGLEVLPPDVNASSARFMPLKGAVRYGLAGIKNVGAGAAEAIVKEREANGPFHGLIDFCARLDPRLVNRKVLETLARCGAFDAQGLHRARLFNGVETVMRRAAASQRDRLSGQGSLFDFNDASAGAAAADALPDCPPWHESELLGAEKELLGIYLSGHPLTRCAWLLRHYSLVTMRGVPDLPADALTRVGGLVVKFEKQVTKKKKLMAKVVLEDMEGTLAAIVFPECFAKYGAVFVENAAVLVCGKVVKKEKSVELWVAEAYPLEQAPRQFTEHISLHLPSSNVKDSLLARVKQVLKAHPGPTPVLICLQFPNNKEVFLSTGSDLKVMPSEQLVRDLEHILGETGVYVAVSSQPCRKANGRNAGGFRRPGRNHAGQN